MTKNALFLAILYHCKSLAKNLWTGVPIPGMLYSFPYSGRIHISHHRISPCHSVVRMFQRLNSSTCVCMHLLAFLFLDSFTCDPRHSIKIKDNFLKSILIHLYSTTKIQVYLNIFVLQKARHLVSIFQGYF